MNEIINKLIKLKKLIKKTKKMQNKISSECFTIGYKGRGMCYPVCRMVHIKDPLLLIGKIVAQWVSFLAI